MYSDKYIKPYSLYSIFNFFSSLWTHTDSTHDAKVGISKSVWHDTRKQKMFTVKHCWLNRCWMYYVVSFCFLSGDRRLCPQQWENMDLNGRKNEEIMVTPVENVYAIVWNSLSLRIYSCATYSLSPQGCMSPCCEHSNR